jgi:hypothetical protein
MVKDSSEELASTIADPSPFDPLEDFDDGDFDAAMGVKEKEERKQKKEDAKKKAEKKAQ